MMSWWAEVVEAFGLSGQVTPLPGERCRNAVLRSGAGAGAEAGDIRYVLKLHPLDQRAAVQAETVALRLLAGLPQVPRPVFAPGGEALIELAVDGVTHVARVLSWLPGLVWSQAFAPDRPASPAVLSGLGRLVARVDRALASLDLAGAGAGLRWNLVDAAAAQDLLGHVVDPERRALAGAVLDRFADQVRPRLAQLPVQVIHNDASDGNVLVDLHADGGPQVAGLIDFGDLCRAPRICGLAVACAYAMFDRADPVGAVLPLVAGYHEVAPLTPAELGLLLDLVRTRLALSVVMAGWQHSREPDNAYLLVSQEQVDPLLRRLDGVDQDLALFRFRDACGYEADPRARTVRRFLALTPSRPVLGDRPPADVPRLTFDWSSGTGAGDWTPDQLFAHLASSGAEVGVGRYLEDRDVYTTNAYASSAGSGGSAGSDGSDGSSDSADGSAGWGGRRTVHLGVDLFVPPGTAVSAPLDGVVQALHDNAAPKDYGPVVVLAHRTDTGEEFFTLYGHLSRTTLPALTVGQKVAAGERFATVGTQQENGGWAPHVHLQVLTSLLGMGVDVPGVGAAADLGLWRSVCPDPNLLLGLPEGTRADPGMRTAQVAAGRSARMSAALSLSYVRPLRIVRGEGAHLYDEDGRGWLDLVNNVAHVGHGHPRVVAAAAVQQAMLNTNTRYLHEAVVEYAERLAATLPDPLSVCFFVNSGSEANDLALRLARAHTGSRDVVVLDHAYHGNLTSLVDVSPYKFDGPGGSGRPPGTHVVPLPDPYRGRYRVAAGEPSTAVTAAYLAKLDEILADGGRTFLAEAIPGTAGQVMLCEGFLAGAYRRVRDAGGVCIADEVQTGFGRVGSAFWAFELHGVVPDIVTMGKPIGNGHPLGAVVTTPEVAKSFLTGMEYFNTFGGNPVSARVGLAVLDVLADERLQANADAVGRLMLDRLREVGERHELVGDVRGRGLFLGVELVGDRAARTPAGAVAGRVVEAVKCRGVLISRDGPDHNVLKIVCREHRKERPM
jgi:4-aminobutyrate aminotransferase-like enzyme/Ser/Thr protein kinase RdoA (MazF antagonist)